MSREFELKDGRAARIETWDYSQLFSYLTQDLPAYDPDGLGIRKIFHGFTLLGPSNLWEFKTGDRYSKENDLSPLEIQSDRTLPDEAYHWSLAVLQEENLAGILVCEWRKTSCMPFWHYLAKFVDVRRDYKNLGIGTHLVRALDQADFLKGKIFCPGGYLPEGRKHIKPIFEKEMEAEDYAIIHLPERPRGDFFEAEAPVEPGVYSLYGRMMASEFK